MKWLVTLDQNADLAAVWERLRSLGCTGDDTQSPIPLDAGEKAIELEGPEDLPARMHGVPHVRGVYPSSEITLY